jgi:hypothetical protein
MRATVFLVVALSCGREGTEKPQVQTLRAAHPTWAKVATKHVGDPCAPGECLDGAICLHLASAGAMPEENWFCTNKCEGNVECGPGTECSEWYPGQRACIRKLVPAEVTR